MNFTQEDANALLDYSVVYKKELFTSLYNDLDILNDMSVMGGIKNSLKIPKLQISEGIKAYATEFEPTKETLFSSRTLTVSSLKRDFTFDPYTYRHLWLGDFMLKGMNPDDMPFVEFISKSFIGHAKAEINNRSYFAKNTTGKDLSTSMDGLAIILENLITDETRTKGSGLVPVATGLTTDVNAVENIEKVIGAHTSEYLYGKDGLVVFVSPEMWGRYQKDYRKRHMQHSEPSTSVPIYVNDTSNKVQIKSCSWMAGSNRIIVTPKNNLVVGIDSSNDVQTISVEKKHSSVEWRITFAMGYQVRDLNAIRINDQI